jgi:prefoldin subunit 5
LLLGTGPIVDPGFNGKLFIPLHNLTSNRYVIKKNAQLISVEFTKLSKNDEWKSIHKSIQKELDSLDFSDVPYIPTGIDANRQINVYIEKALQKDDAFCKDPKNEIIVNSSMQSLKKDTAEAIKRINESLSQISPLKKEIDESLKRTEHRMTSLQTFSILTIIGMMISIISLFIAAGWYFSKATELADATQQIQEQRIQYDKDKVDYLDRIQELEDDIKSLHDELSNINKN